MKGQILRRFKKFCRVTRKLKKVSRFSRAKQRQGNVLYSCVRAKLFLCYLEKKVRCTDVLDLMLWFFMVLVVFTVSLVLLDFKFSLRKL